jgi:hypothetical protein
METGRQGVSFEMAKRALWGCRRPSALDALEMLQRVRMTVTSAKLLQEYRPSALSQRITGLFDYAANELHSLDEEALSLLSDLFPCDTDFMLEEMINSEMGGMSIMILPLMNLSFDEFNEGVEEPENFGDGLMARLLIFARYLDIGIAAEYYQKADEHFGWQIESPPIISYRDGEVDGPAFVKRMKRDKLADFTAAFEVIWQANNNPFLDWSMDEVYENCMNYDVETVRKLVDTWAEAQPVVERLRAAAERGGRERWIFQRIIKLWDRSTIVEGRKPKGKKKTLVEIFMEEENQS